MARKGRASDPDGQIGLFFVPETPERFRKAVPVVHAVPNAPMTLVQRKLLNAWIKNAMANPADDEGWHTIQTSKVLETIDYESRNRVHLYNSARQMMNIVFEWDKAAPAHKRVKWKASVLFPEVEVRENGTIAYQISNQMRPHILNPEMYAQVDLNVVKRFKKAASIPLYEFCVRFENLKLTAEISWETFRDMLVGDTPRGKSSYQEYKHFKAKVLNPCMAEVNTESPLTVSLLETKEGRRVATIRFAVEKRGSMVLQDDAISDEQQMELIGEMVRLGTPQSEAKRIARKHRPEELRAAIDFTKKRAADRRSAKLENPAAYFRQALAQGWAVVEEAKVKDSPAADETQLEDEYAAHQVKEAEGYFRELDPPDQTSLLGRYNEQQEMTQLRVGKKATKASQTAFFRWLAFDTWGEPSAEDLLKFAKEKLRKRG